MGIQNLIANWLQWRSLCHGLAYFLIELVIVCVVIRGVLLVGRESCSGFMEFGENFSNSTIQWNTVLNQCCPPLCRQEVGVQLFFSLQVARLQFFAINVFEYRRHDGILWFRSKLNTVAMLPVKVSNQIR